MSFPIHVKLFFRIVTVSYRVSYHMTNDTIPLRYERRVKIREGLKAVRKE